MGSRSQRSVFVLFVLAGMFLTACSSDSQADTNEPVEPVEPVESVEPVVADEEIVDDTESTPATRLAEEMEAMADNYEARIAELNEQIGVIGDELTPDQIELVMERQMLQASLNAVTCRTDRFDDQTSDDNSVSLCVSGSATFGPVDE